MKLNRHTVFWALWVGAFLAYELPAVANAAEGDTFSEFFWGLFRINDKLPLWQSIPIHGAIVAFGIWLIGHLGFGLWGGPRGRLFDDAGPKGSKLWRGLFGNEPPAPPNFSDFSGQATPEQVAEYERRIGKPPEQIEVFMTEDPDGPLDGEPSPQMKDMRPLCPGCDKFLAHNGMNWVHFKDNSAICARNKNGYLTGMKGHRWKDTEGPHSICDGCHLLFAQWGGSLCARALPGTDYRL